MGQEREQAVQCACTGGIRVRHQEQGAQALQIQCESRCAVTNRSNLHSGRGLADSGEPCCVYLLTDQMDRELHWSGKILECIRYKHCPPSISAYKFTALSFWKWKILYNRSTEVFADARTSVDFLHTLSGSSIWKISDSQVLQGTSSLLLRIFLKF